jgi:hypothetical protein
VAREVAVGNHDGGGGAHDGVDEAVGAPPQCVVCGPLHPHVMGAEQSEMSSSLHCVRAPTVVRGRALHIGVAGRHAVVEVRAVDGDVGHVLQCDARRRCARLRRTRRWS